MGRERSFTTEAIRAASQALLGSRRPGLPARASSLPRGAGESHCRLAEGLAAGQGVQTAPRSRQIVEIIATDPLPLQFGTSRTFIHHAESVAV